MCYDMVILEFWANLWSCIWRISSDAQKIITLEDNKVFCTTSYFDQKAAGFNDKDN